MNKFSLFVVVVGFAIAALPPEGRAVIFWVGRRFLDVFFMVAG